jgi:hypothetical protein
MHKDDDTILASIMQCIPKMHKLTVVYEKDSVEEWPEFIKAICNSQSLKKMRVKEWDLDLTQVPEGYGAAPPGWRFPDYLISNILSSPRVSLETFAHFSSLSLHSTVFAKIQAQAHFRTLVFRASLQFSLRDVFNSPTPWGSASTLTKLVIRTCSGTHYAVVAAHVAAGVFGNLKWLSVINSGYDDPAVLEEFAAKPPAWRIGVLERLDVDHAASWEVATLSAIHVKELIMTRVFRRAVIEALDAGGWPELKILRVPFPRQEDDSDDPLSGLKQACENRKIKLEIGAEPHGTCHCHDD